MYRTKIEEIAAMLMGDDEQDIISEATGVEADGRPLGGGGFSNDASQPPANWMEPKTESSIVDAPNPTADGYDSDPMGPPASSGPNTPDWAISDEATKYQGIVNNYRPGTYKEKGVERHTPQQFGQMGDPITDDEGPRSPLETAEELAKIEDSPGGMEKRIAQRTIGHGLHNPARQAAYDDYVTGSRERRDAERTAQQARARTNRADIADRESRTAQKMSDYNSMLTGGASVGEDDRLPQVNRIGGIGFVKGRYRPFTEDEAAGADLKRANAEYVRSKPAVEGEKLGVRGRELDIREALGKLGVDQKQLAAIMGFLGKQETNNIRQQAVTETARHNKAGEGIADKRTQLLETMHKARSGDAAARLQMQQGAFKTDALNELSELGKIITAKEGFGSAPRLGGLRGPDETQRDRVYDPKTGTFTDNVTHGDYQEHVERFKALVKTMADLDMDITLSPELEKLADRLLAAPTK